MIENVDLFSLNGIAINSNTIKEALDGMLPILHKTIIFDNMAVYAFDNDLKILDVIYAKSMGRGRSAEADISWGENLANQVLLKKEIVYQKPVVEDPKDRLKNAHLLGLPISIKTEMNGIITFIRYGGPTFTTGDIKTLQFMSSQIGWIMHVQKMQKEIDRYIAQNQATQLQEDFINTITHEIRNPLGFIKGYATTLLRSDADWSRETQKEFLQIIDHETDQLEELIGNLLDSARLQSGQLRMEMQPIRIDAVLKDVIQRSKIHHPNIKISLDVLKEIPIVNADPRRLAQVFTNLINNGAKYAPESKIEVTVSRIKKVFQIAFRDYGPGIPEKYLPFIFDRFFRNPEQPVTIHGTGLGLYICRQIVRSHGGEITVTSRVNQGTTFIVELPINIILKNSRPRSKK